jgi:hypothetical protein
MYYLITFACYGHHLHGSESGSVDRRHNVPGTHILDSNPARAAAETKQMEQAPWKLSGKSVPIANGSYSGCLQVICQPTSRHGSTRYLWKEEHVSAAVQYVAFEQGEAMAVYQSDASEP